MLLLFVVFSSVLSCAWGHGRLIDPPSRSSMWRFGFNNPSNFNDNELFCGGFTRQWNSNGGKCGICGDPWDAPEPRENEDGGKYGNGIIVRTYKKGQTITAVVDLTAPHLGYFEFRLCPVDGGVKADQNCLDKYVLEQADGSGSKFYPGSRKEKLEIKLKLPNDLTCQRCVFQWNYRTGNTWGKCPDGSVKTGCGPQEHFRGCADVAITP